VINVKRLNKGGGGGGGGWGKYDTRLNSAFASCVRLGFINHWVDKTKKILLPV
jgi:hypothetical protein